MSLNLKINKFINFLNINYKNKNVLVKYKKNRLVVGVLENLKKENVITDYFIDSENYCNIYLKYNSLGESIIKNIEIIYRRPFELYFSVKELKSKNFINRYILKNGDKSSFYIFSTTKGLLSYKECINLNLGGLMLLQVKCI